MTIETAATAADQTITYVVVLSDGRDSVAESGPHPTSTDALTFAASVMGNTVAQVLSMPQTYELDTTNTGQPVVGYTIERYSHADGTDGTWMLNGGIKPALVAA
jgi:hypothetical protein